MDKPTVSIIIVNFTSGCDLESCVLALQKNTDSAYEVIIVDNASTDESLNFLEEGFPNVKILKSAVNLGYARAINWGLSHAQADFLAVLNPDVTTGPNWLSPLTDFLARNPQVGAVTPCILLYHSPTRLNALGQNIHVTGLGFNRKLNYPVKEADLFPVRVGGVHGCAFVVRTNEFRSIGGMNEDYFLYHEDVELSLRLALAGFEIFTIPASTVLHKYSLHMTPEKLHWLERHRWMTIFSTYKAATLLFLLPILIVTEMLMAAYCLMKGWSFLVAKSKALAWTFENGAMIQKSRQRTQALRRVSDWEILSKLRLLYDYDQFMALLMHKGGWINEAVSSLFPWRSHDRVA